MLRCNIYFYMVITDYRFPLITDGVFWGACPTTKSPQIITKSDCLRITGWRNNEIRPLYKWSAKLCSRPPPNHHTTLTKEQTYLASGGGALARNTDISTSVTDTFGKLKYTAEQPAQLSVVASTPNRIRWPRS